ncbi:hypothetical protein N7495_000344 [Penicillium taxi]|uniref:uncharacterized protein n=1 Tax=Penicillium taxi TaxID=168475 RepID=UPI00254501ED|nr:uncharacterized protein N7495_000344 [Penicillium taxi]KAJ5907662.1 hypothetical protein N7495_000344 [Penicillium taxi]
MPFTNSIASFLHAVPSHLPQSQHERLALAVGAAALIGSSALIIPAAYRDYTIFKSYGPGGLPNNIFGWVFVRGLYQHFGREMLSTEEYDRRKDAAEGHGKEDEGYLTLTPEQLALRQKDGRPVIGPHVVPQRQLTQVPDEDVMEKLSTTFRSFGLRNHHLVKSQRSNLEAHADALFLADNLPATDLAVQMKGEITHLHQGNDHSAHLILAPTDCKRVIDAGWGQRHAFSGISAMPFLTFGMVNNLPSEYILIYAPRNEEEIEVVMQIIAASVKFMTGRENVR